MEVFIYRAADDGHKMVLMTFVPNEDIKHFERLFTGRFNEVRFDLDVSEVNLH